MAWRGERRNTGGAMCISGIFVFGKRRQREKREEWRTLSKIKAERDGHPGGFCELNVPPARYKL
jgi:hypothetical protein